MFTAEQLAAIAALTAIIGVPFGFLLRWVWDRWWRKADADEDKSSKTLSDHGAKLITFESRIGTLEMNDREQLTKLSRVETEQNRLEGKVGGLQDFWRSEFGKLRTELREDQEAFRRELREDQANTERRLTELLTSQRAEERKERQEHQTRVHDRLNVIAADQAKLLTQFVDQLVDHKSEPK